MASVGSAARPTSPGDSGDEIEEEELNAFAKSGEDGPPVLSPESQDCVSSLGEAPSRAHMKLVMQARSFRKNTDGLLRECDGVCAKVVVDMLKPTFKELNRKVKVKAAQEGVESAVEELKLQQRAIDKALAELLKSKRTDKVTNRRTKALLEDVTDFGLYGKDAVANAMLNGMNTKLSDLEFLEQAYMGKTALDFFFNDQTGVAYTEAEVRSLVGKVMGETTSSIRQSKVSTQVALLVIDKIRLFVIERLGLRTNAQAAAFLEDEYLLSKRRFYAALAFADMIRAYPGMITWTIGASFIYSNYKKMIQFMESDVPLARFLKAEALKNSATLAVNALEEEHASYVSLLVEGLKRNDGPVVPPTLKPDMFLTEENIENLSVADRVLLVDKRIEDIVKRWKPYNNLRVADFVRNGGKKSLSALRAAKPHFFTLFVLLPEDFQKPLFKKDIDVDHLLEVAKEGKAEFSAVSILHDLYRDRVLAVYGDGSKPVGQWSLPEKAAALLLADCRTRFKLLINWMQYNYAKYVEENPEEPTDSDKDLIEEPTGGDGGGGDDGNLPSWLRLSAEETNFLNLQPTQRQEWLSQWWATKNEEMPPLQPADEKIVEEFHDKCFIHEEIPYMPALKKKFNQDYFFKALPEYMKPYRVNAALAGQAYLHLPHNVDGTIGSKPFIEWTTDDKSATMVFIKARSNLERVINFLEDKCLDYVDEHGPPPGDQLAPAAAAAVKKALKRSRGAAAAPSKRPRGDSGDVVPPWRQPSEEAGPA